MSSTEKFWTSQLTGRYYEIKKCSIRQLKILIDTYYLPQNWPWPWISKSKFFLFFFAFAFYLSRGWNFCNLIVLLKSGKNVSSSFNSGFTILKSPVQSHNEKQQKSGNESGNLYISHAVVIEIFYRDDKSDKKSFIWLPSSYEIHRIIQFPFWMIRRCNLLSMTNGDGARS